MGLLESIKLMRRRTAERLMRARSYLAEKRLGLAAKYDSDAEARLKLIREFKKEHGLDILDPKIYGKDFKSLKDYLEILGTNVSRFDRIEEEMKSKGIQLTENQRRYLQILKKEVRRNPFLAIDLMYGMHASEEAIKTIGLSIKTLQSAPDDRKWRTYLRMLLPGRSEPINKYREWYRLARWRGLPWRAAGRFWGLYHSDAPKMDNEFGKHYANVLQYVENFARLHPELESVLGDPKKAAEFADLLVKIGQAAKGKPTQKRGEGMVFEGVRKVRRKIRERIFGKKEEKKEQGQIGPEEKALAEEVMKENRSKIQAGDVELRGEDVKELRRKLGAEPGPTELENLLEMGAAETDTLRHEKAKSKIKGRERDLWKVHEDIIRKTGNPELEMLLDVVQTMDRHGVKKIDVRLEGHRRTIRLDELKGALREYEESRDYSKIAPYLIYLKELVGGAQKIRQRFAEPESAEWVTRVGSIQAKSPTIKMSQREMARQHVEQAYRELLEYVRSDPRYRRLATGMEDATGIMKILLRQITRKEAEIPEATAMELLRTLKDKKYEHLERALQAVEREPHITGATDREIVKSILRDYAHLFAGPKAIRSRSFTQKGLQNIEEFADYLKTHPAVREALSRHTRRILENPADSMAVSELSEAIKSALRDFAGEKNLPAYELSANEEIARKLAEEIAKAHARGAGLVVGNKVAEEMVRTYLQALENRGLNRR